MMNLLDPLVMLETNVFFYYSPHTGHALQQGNIYFRNRTFRIVEINDSEKL